VEKLYTVKEIAKILSVSRNTIWRWVREGKLKSIKLSNGATRFTEKDIQEFMGVENNGNR
jgi:excisionase family DNA binding protein